MENYLNYKKLYEFLNNLGAFLYVKIEDINIFKENIDDLKEYFLDNVSIKEKEIMFKKAAEVKKTIDMLNGKINDFFDNLNE